VVQDTNLLLAKTHASHTETLPAETAKEQMQEHVFNQLSPNPFLRALLVIFVVVKMEQKQMLVLIAILNAKIA
jgi:hypothetical protein